MKRGRRADDRGQPPTSYAQNSSDEALLRRLASGARELNELRLENGDLRRELNAVLEKDRRFWEEQAETRAQQHEAAEQLRPPDRAEEGERRADRRLAHLAHPK